MMGERVGLKRKEVNSCQDVLIHLENFSKRSKKFTNIKWKLNITNATDHIVINTGVRLREIYLSASEHSHLRAELLKEEKQWSKNLIESERGQIVKAV